MAPLERENFSIEEVEKNIALVLKILLNNSSYHSKLIKFTIYSPENQALRTFEKEGQIQPLGINGEGLFKLIKFLNSETNQDKLNQIKEKLRLIDWFRDFEVPENLSPLQTSLQIKDKYLDRDLTYFDQKSSNEGFLFLLFYFALFISDLTPKFFAIDNIDASLNPRLCRRLMQELVELAKKHDKQVIFTTHNPAVLDGLDLDDDEQRLFVIYRNQLGHTKARRILKPEPLEGQEPVKLSEAFLRGYIGGLPKNF
ncbi:AAA family ATPase [Microcoleus sp. BR0-C5]|uniref:AAA family ATPase n=1 Tax=Microcoleus sp. BR0-C5 TaxID=2818713 RepID=UPI002FCF9286